MKLGQGYVFTCVCDSVHGGMGVSVSVLGVGGGSQSLSWGVSVRGVSVMETPCMVMSRQYASYWNAFLFKLISNLKFWVKFKLQGID